MIVFLVLAWWLGAFCGVVLMAVMAASGRDSLEEEFRSLPGSAHPPGVVSEARKEPGSTPSWVDHPEDGFPTEPPPKPADSLSSVTSVRHIKIVP